jgi:hypothetical protein
MLEIEEDTQYGLARGAIVDAVEVGGNIAIPCKSENGKQFWLLFSNKTKHVVA